MNVGYDQVQDITYSVEFDASVLKQLRKRYLMSSEEVVELSHLRSHRLSFSVGKIWRHWLLIHGLNLTPVRVCPFTQA